MGAKRSAEMKQAIKWWQQGTPAFRAAIWANIAPSSLYRIIKRLKLKRTTAR